MSTLSCGSRMLACVRTTPNYFLQESDPQQNERVLWHLKEICCREGIIPRAGHDRALELMTGVLKPCLQILTTTHGTNKLLNQSDNGMSSFAIGIGGGLEWLHLKDSGICFEDSEIMRSKYYVVMYTCL